MLDTVFYFVLNMSVASCFVIAVLLLIRQIRPIPRRVIYPLWTLALLRLVLPFTLTSSLSLFNFTGALVKRQITVGTGLAAMNTVGAAERVAPMTYKTESLRQVFLAASVVWAIIAVAMLLTAGVLYLLTRRDLKKAVHIRGNLYRSDMLLSPVLTGIFRPRILLPASLDPRSAEGRMVLAHESVHRRRLDNLWRLLGICIACLHWFNPFAWIMLKAFFTDMELSCDETLIKKYNAEERKAYASALLNFAEDKRLLVATAFGRSGVKVRVVNILNYKRLTVIGAAASILFLLVVAAVLITNPQLRG